MSVLVPRTRTFRPLVLRTLALVTVLLFCLHVSAQAQTPPLSEPAEVAPAGFGDRHNTTAWSMQWWQGHLYVGTQRSFTCWRAAMIAAAQPDQAATIYPPDQPDAECTDSPADLAMQAEIWRWTPESDTWERVYQSPQDVPIPGHPGKFVARDVGFRGMLAFTDADGTEALYVTGVSAREMYSDTEKLPPPRLLRTTDGTHFTAVPQEKGTVLGDLDLTGLRTGAIFDGRMYLSNGTARGEGVLLEARNPAGGNDNFRQVTPPGMVIWDAIPYNGHLYVGVASEDGFSVVKTDAQGALPYTFTTVITRGGYLERPSQSVVSLYEFQGRLYVGTYLPAEIYRINPDDSWDLVMGEPRQTPEGWKYPISGLDPGFGWRFNVQIYRMHEISGTLYLGTLDVSRDVTEFAYQNAALDRLLRWHYGYDLYRTEDGKKFEPVTINGFGDEFQITVRTFETTPYGWFMGTGSYWYGLEIWRWPPVQGVQEELRQFFLPFIRAETSKARAAGSTQVGNQSPAAVPSAPASGECGPSPRQLAAEMTVQGVVLAWERPEGSGGFRILRSDVRTADELPVSDWTAGWTLPSPFVEAGHTTGDLFVDRTAGPGGSHFYVVVADGGAGCTPASSNLVRVPGLAPPMTLGTLQETLDRWLEDAPEGSQREIRSILGAARENLTAGDGVEAVARLGGLQRWMAGKAIRLPWWQAEELQAMLAELEWRIYLMREGLIDPASLE